MAERRDALAPEEVKAMSGEATKTTNLTDTTRVNFREFRKIATIKAGKIPIPFVVDTLEGTFEGKAGDWLAEGIEGERYIIDDAIFKKTYEEVV